MKYIIIILFFPLLASSQGAIVDAGGNIINYQKYTDSVPGVYATGTRLRIKADSVALALVASLALKLNLSDSAAMLLGYVRKNTNIPFANGGISSAAATSATTGTMTVSMTTSVITITPTGACTFNASGGVAGQVITFSITTSGTTSFVLTFGTNFRKTGTLATGTVSARFFSVTFICINGTIWQEVSRTAVQT